MDRQRFGRFEVVRLLSRSMTDVYLARDDRFGRQVILKVIPDAGDETAGLLIEAECRGAAIQQELQQRDRRILQVFEWGVDDGCFFVALEYFPGRTLADLLRIEGPLAPERAARFAAEICNQLRSLHGTPEGRASGQKSTIHGDIKPSNVQIGAGDELRLLDFGIAKLIRPGHDLTHHQLGSPSYCSPERLRQAQVDIQADLWSLGVTLYEMLTGTPPFQAASTQELEKLIAQRRTPRLALPENCPPALCSIVSKALAHDVGERYPSAALFEADLLQFLKGESIPQTKGAASIKPVTSAPRAVHVPAVADRKPASPSPPAVAKESVLSAPAQTVAVVPPRRTRPGALTLALLTGVLAGLLLFFPALTYARLRNVTKTLNEPKNYARVPAAELASDWQSYQTVRHSGTWWRGMVRAGETTAVFRRNLLASARRLLSSAESGSQDALSARDWERLRLCLLYALEINPDDRRARGELHLVDGNLRLLNGTESSSASAVSEFRRAASLLPKSPLPHLALAHAYAYDLHNPTAVHNELRQAERLGCKLNVHERQEQADAYLFRAEWALDRAGSTPATDRPDLRKYLYGARSDLEHARSLYEPLASASGINDKLEQVFDDQDKEIKLETADLVPVHPKRRMVLLKVKFGKRTGTFQWQ